MSQRPGEGSIDSMLRFMPWLGGLCLLIGPGIFLFFVLPILNDWHAAKHWEPVPATLLSAGLETRATRDGTTCEAVARYRYRYGGRERIGERVSLAAWGDDIGDFQRRLASELERAEARGDPVTVYVNPADPAQAVINRDLRFGLVAVYLLFVLLMPVTGVGLLAVARNERTDFRDPGIVPPDQPWLARRAWASPSVAAGSQVPMQIAWAATLCWLLVWATMSAYLLDEILAGNTPGIVVLLADAAGLGMLAWATTMSLGQQRFGRVLLQMDPHPGAIGGDVGGWFDLPLVHDPAHRFVLTLHCEAVTRVREGRATFDAETVWSECREFASTATADGLTRVCFRFAVPAGLPPSSPPAAGFHRWTLDVSAALPGVDLARSFELPVFATGMTSRVAARVTGGLLEGGARHGRS